MVKTITTRATGRRAALTVSLLLIAVFSSSPALSAPKQLEKITVWGENITENVVGRSSIAPITETTLQYHVRFDDLDLATRGGEDALRDRVISAARKACADLDRMYFRWGKDVSCIRSAEKSARPQVEEVIKQARHGQ